MSGIAFLIILLCILTAIELFVIYKHLRNRKYGMTVENIILYLALVFLLIFNNSFRFPIRNFIIVFLVCTILCHALVGECFDVYHKNKYFDRFLHCFGSFTFALFSYSIMQNILGPVQSPKSYISVLVVVLGISIGTIFEEIEFLIDSLSKKDKNSKNQHGLIDTNFDLLSNIVGSFVAGFVSSQIFIS